MSYGLYSVVSQVANQLDGTLAKMLLLQISLDDHSQHFSPLVVLARTDRHCSPIKSGSLSQTYLGVSLIELSGTYL